MQRWIALMLIVAGMLTVIGPAQAAANEFVQPGSQPNTDGTTIVWVNHGVYAARFADQQPFLVASDPSLTYTFPDVSGDLVVWEQDCSGSNCPPPSMNIEAKNLTTDETYAVGTGYAPQISGTRVIYVSGSQLILRDLATMTDPVTLATAPDGWLIQDPQISGERVAWAELQGTSTWRIFIDVIGQTPTKLNEGTTIGFFGIDLSGDELVEVTSANQILAGNLANDVGAIIPANPYDQHPTTNSRYVFWDRSNFGPGTNPNGTASRHRGL